MTKALRTTSAKAPSSSATSIATTCAAWPTPCGGDPRRLEKLITEFPRIGPTGAQIFCREAQAVWPWLRPYFDRKALDGAKKAGLPTDPGRLAKLVPGDDSARLAAALVRRSSQR